MLLTSGAPKVSACRRVVHPEQRATLTQSYYLLSSVKGGKQRLKAAKLHSSAVQSAPEWATMLVAMSLSTVALTVHGGPKVSPYPPPSPGLRGSGAERAPSVRRGQSEEGHACAHLRQALRYANRTTPRACPGPGAPFLPGEDVYRRPPRRSAPQSAASRCLASPRQCLPPRQCPPVQLRDRHHPLVLRHEESAGHVRGTGEPDWQGLDGVRVPDHSGLWGMV